LGSAPIIRVPKSRLAHCDWDPTLASDWVRSGFAPVFAAGIHGFWVVRRSVEYSVQSFRRLLLRGHVHPGIQSHAHGWRRFVQDAVRFSVCVFCVTSFIIRFRAHNWRTGVTDWGNFGVMPIRSVPTNTLVSNSWYHSPFSHDTESASPGYYTVHLDAWNATAELAASGTHAGVHRYTCHGDGQCGVLIDACHSVESTMSNTCRNASISIAVGSNGAATVTGWVRMSGGLSGVADLFPLPAFAALLLLSSFTV
jgi:hypothetical protein